MRLIIRTILIRIPYLMEMEVLLRPCMAVIKDAPDAMRLGDIAKRLVKVVKQYDISRPVTAGLAGVAMSNETEYPGALDIAGYNYTESRYDSDHLKYPGRVIYGSENRHDMEAWRAVRIKNTYWGNFCGLVSTIWGIRQMAFAWILFGAFGF